MGSGVGQPGRSLSCDGSAGGGDDDDDDGGTMWIGAGACSACSHISSVPRS